MAHLICPLSCSRQTPALFVPDEADPLAGPVAVVIPLPVTVELRRPLADVVFAGGGDDTIHTDAHNDALIFGGLGYDTLDYQVMDRVMLGMSVHIDLAPPADGSQAGVDGAVLHSNTAIDRFYSIEHLVFDGLASISISSGDWLDDATLIGMANEGANPNAANALEASISGRTISVGGLDITVLAGLATSTDTSIYGGDGNDTLNGAAAVVAVRLYGEAGNDNITGGTVNDVLQGAAGNDTITGGAGADTITGGTGADLLTGGAGADTFVFAVGDSFAATSLATSAAFFGNGVDVITDFSSTAAQQAAGTNDVLIPVLTPTNPLQTGGLGANATINADGTVQINQGVNALTAGVNNVYVSGTWNAAQSSFTDANAGADYLVFQVTLATSLAAGTALDITNQFELAEAVVLDNPAF